MTRFTPFPPQIGDIPPSLSVYWTGDWVKRREREEEVDHTLGIPTYEVEEGLRQEKAKERLAKARRRMLDNNLKLG